MMDTAASAKAPAERHAPSVKVRQLLTFLYYLMVLAGLVVLYGGGDAATTGFIYQSF